MGGEISLKSVAGEGSEFKFTFPIKVYSEEFIDEHNIPDKLGAPDFSKKKILIVEDDPIGRVFNIVFPKLIIYCIYFMI